MLFFYWENDFVIERVSQIWICEKGIKQGNCVIRKRMMQFPCLNITLQKQGLLCFILEQDALCNRWNAPR